MKGWMREWRNEQAKEQKRKKQKNCGEASVWRPQIPLLHLWGATFLSGGHNPAMAVAEKAFGRQEGFFF